MSILIDVSKPFKLSPSRAWRTYLGGKLLDRLKGVEAEDGHFPEEWMMSVVSARNAGREAQIDEGLSFVAGIHPPLSLKELIDAYPAKLIGQAHAASFGKNPGVLVKLIDSAERLTVQVHPDRPAARSLFGSDFGKTECWHILGGRTIGAQAPCIYLGFKPGITREVWRSLFDSQDIPGMLDCLHRFDAEPGATFLIEGGVPHAIGAGCFLAEIQEPTDFTVRVERTTPSGFALADSMCHQGLGFDRMFDCFAYRGLSREETALRWKIPPSTTRSESGGQEIELIGYRNTAYFRLVELLVGGSFALEEWAAFSGLYVLSGRGSIDVGGAAYDFSQGDQFFLPADLHGAVIRSAADQPCRALRFFGPK